MHRVIVVLLGLAACGRFGFDSSQGPTTSDATDAPDAPPPDSDNGIPVAACPAKPMTQGTVVTTAAQLVSAVTNASAGDTILLANGTYLLPSSMTVTVPNLTIRSMSNNAADAIIDGGNTITPMFYVRTSSVSFIALTMRRSADEAIFIEADASSDLLDSLIYDVTFVDNQGPGIRAKSYALTSTGPYSDNGTVACSRFLHTAANDCGTDGVFGIRLMATRTWTVRDNYFDGNCAPTRIRAMWFDNGARDVNVVGNVFMNNMNNFITGTQASRTYADPLPNGCTGTPQFWGGVFCNNRLFGLNVTPHTGPDFEEGIAMWSTCDTWVVHNTVVSIPGTETFENIEYRYPDAYVHLFNNLLEVAPLARDGGTADPASTTSLYSSLADFVDANNGDLHLSASAIVSPGTPLTGTPAAAICGTDAAGISRNISAPTPGAYER